MGVHKTTLANYIRKGKLHGIRIGVMHFMTDDQVVAAKRYLESLRKEPKYQHTLEVLEHARQAAKDPKGSSSMNINGMEAPTNNRPPPAIETLRLARITTPTVRVLSQIEATLALHLGRIADVLEEIATRPSEDRKAHLREFIAGDREH
jgi:hypothetical protein